jgi:hypothetical protein
MTRFPLPSFSANPRRLFVASLASLAFAGACSDDEATVAPPVDLALAITALDGAAPDASDPLRCDGLAVQVEISPARSFTLRPLHACGSSSRCGYVHVEGLDANGNVLGSVDSVTTLALLVLPSESLGQLESVRAALLRGVDGDPVTNRDESEVVAQVELDRPAPECATGQGGQGAGGGSAVAGGPGEAGSGGAAAGGAPASLGGAGAGGVPASLGGAAGADAEPNAGSGGA